MPITRKMDQTREAAPAPVPAAPAQTAFDDRMRRRFVVALSLATALPWLVLPAFGMGSSGASLDVRRLAFLGGAPHVLSTFALYADPGFRPLVSAHRTRFLVLPVVLLVVAPVIYQFSPPHALAFAVLAAGAWATHHFSRQNLGVYSFVCAAEGGARPSDDERRLIEATGVVGVIGVMAYATALGNAHLAAIGPPLRLATALAMLGVAAIGMPLVWARRSQPLVAAFFLESLLFFVPLLVFGERGGIPYGAAHGLQYLVFMAVLVLHRPDGRRRVRRLVVLGLAIPVLGGLLFRVARDAGSGALSGVLVALTATHFLLDASIWRLRDSRSRAYVTARFPFLLGRSPSSAARSGSGPISVAAGAAGGVTLDPST